jgi:hypothetical protein
VHLTETLEIPLRERNWLLLAAGYAPIYAATPWSSSQLSAVLPADQATAVIVCWPAWISTVW